jgi:hypothetical protein
MKKLFEPFEISKRKMTILLSLLGVSLGFSVCLLTLAISVGAWRIAINQLFPIFVGIASMFFLIKDNQ